MLFTHSCFPIWLCASGAGRGWPAAGGRLRRGSHPGLRTDCYSIVANILIQQPLSDDVLPSCNL